VIAPVAIILILLFLSACSSAEVEETYVDEQGVTRPVRKKPQRRTIETLTRDR